MKAKLNFKLVKMILIKNKITLNLNWLIQGKELTKTKNFLLFIQAELKKKII